MQDLLTASPQTTNPLAQRLRRLTGLILCLILLLLLAAALFRWDRTGSLQDPRMQTLLTCIGLAVGTWLAGIQARAGERFVKTARISLIAILFSEVCYLILVWTSWKMHPVVWRFWWLSFVAAVAATHIVWLRLAAAPDRRLMMRITVVCALLAACMLGGLALARHIPPTITNTYLWLVLPPAAVSMLGSITLWLRNYRLQKKPVSRGVKIGWVITAQAALVAIAFYAGRITAPAPAVFERGPSPLAQVPLETLNVQVVTDLSRLRSIISPGLDELSARAAALSADLAKARARDGRTLYTPEEEDRVRALFMSYLAYRDALLRLVATYAGFESVHDPEARARCMLVGYTAGSMVFEASLKLVALYRDDIVRAKLNEADPKWGLPAGMFDRIAESVTNPRHSETLAEIAAYFDAKREGWAAGEVLPKSELDWIEQRQAKSRATIQQLAPAVAEPRWKQIVARVRKDTYSPLYATQSMLSCWIGDTRLIRWQPFIQIDQIHAMQKQLQPGDILLERRNWFLSNAFLPGFWPHSALYIGTPQDLERLGLLRKENGRWVADPAIAAHLPEYLKLAADGQVHTVLEAISDGVVFNSLTESMHADYVAVLRPRLTDAQKADAIRRAFEHIGKPYDFEFDFSTSDKLVCSELVYRAYSGLLNFGPPYLQKILGREALPPLEIARKFRDELEKPTRQLDFVLFLDGDPIHHAAKLAGESVFCASVDRPRAFNE